MLAISKGYRQRTINQWKIARWQTFMLMHNGIADPSKANINSPSDLMTFEDEENADSMTEEDKEELLGMIHAMNKS